MARILFVDDDDSRWKVFKRLSIGNVIVRAEDYNEAIKKLEHGGWDEVFLDHDLSDFNEVAERTGNDIVDYIVKNVEKYGDTKFIVHSLNFPASQTMLSKLRSAGLQARVKSWLLIQQEDKTK